MASQCETLSVWGSALIMTVPDYAIKRRKRSEEQTPNNNFIFFRAYNICVLSSFSRNLSRMFANNRCEVNDQIRDKIYWWLVWVMDCWIICLLWYCHDHGVTHVLPRHLGPVSNRRVTRNIRLYSYLELSGNPISSGERPTLRRVSCIKWRIHAQRQTFVRYLFPLHIQHKITEIVEAEKYGFVVTEPSKSVLFTIVNRRFLEMGPNTAMSMDSDCAPLENVEDKLYLVGVPLLRAVMFAGRIDVFGLTRFTINWVSRNLIAVFDSASFSSGRNLIWLSWI